MYYLVTIVMDIEQCIDKCTDDIYKDGQTYRCTQDLDFVKGHFVRNIRIRCSESPKRLIDATVYRD